MVTTLGVERLQNPHSTLGLHDGVIRFWRPSATELFVELQGEVVPVHRVDDLGLFELPVNPSVTPLDYRIYHEDGRLAHDPYSFWPTIGEVDEHLFNQGTHYELYNVLGARPITHQGCEGVVFAVWAPNAKTVSLVGEINGWDGRRLPMRLMGESGIWELFVPGVEPGESYKYEIRTQSDDLLIKSDPFARTAEMRPDNASKVARIDTYEWRDSEWMERRERERGHPKPMVIYEVHPGSWRQKDDGGFLNYRELAVELAAYCHQLGFTHIELTPIMEHPLDESWGYQVSGYYAVTSRFGTPEDFQWFVDYMHTHEIGVILDWVPGHFPTDTHSLAHFDGTALYEHCDHRQGYHPHWNTHIFNYGRHEVSNFLIANALYWFKEMHIDGLRVDAVASMLYLDYGREEGEWVPNKEGGRDNLEAVEFLKHLNSIVHDRHPGAMMMAEESTSYPGITRSLDQGGLGFDMKWNMGWMNDTLSYFATDSLFRSHHQNQLTFGLIYAFSERFMLPLSHDEVVHGKGSLLSKMPGDQWQKFANLRLLYSYMMCQPGKKLLFMSGELAQWDEWNCKESIQWHLLDFPNHSGIQEMVREINYFYREHPSLWEQDFDHTGFQWVDFADSQHSVIAYKRKSSRSELLIVHNFTPITHEEYTLYTGPLDNVEELFNTDHERFGGSGRSAGSIEMVHGDYEEVVGIKFTLPPLSTLIFSV